MISAQDSEIGIELAEKYKPDMILLDINLPDKDGFEVLKYIRTSELIKNTPVIAVSANAMSGEIQRGLDAGFDEYVTKPIKIQRLLDVSMKILNKAPNRE